MDFMSKDRDHFQNYVAEDYTRYIQRKRQDGCYANNPEIQASSELFNRPIEVYTPENGISNGPLNIFHGSYDSSGSVPIRLLYTGSAHYDAIIDTNQPGVGHGLGLPGMTSQPTAKRIMKAQLLVSDLEATEHEMKEAVIQASLGGSFCPAGKEMNVGLLLYPTVVVLLCCYLPLLLTTSGFSLIVLRAQYFYLV